MKKEKPKSKTPNQTVRVSGVVIDLIKKNMKPMETIGEVIERLVVQGAKK